MMMKLQELTKKDLAEASGLGLQAPPKKFDSPAQEGKKNLYHPVL